MARTIDEKVVEMRFDNQNFESNVAQSMSTLDKLKNALNFSGVENAFSGISSAADKVSFNGLSGALDGVSEKFSALEAVAVGALMNIGAKVSDLAIKTAKELTIDQVTAGFDKYAKKTEAVQMIMNATGMEIKDVSNQLERLNWYTDETSYDFAEMTASIGKFTAAGIDLETAVTSMQGIANWAGVSGANKQEANRAMYNISQALSAGYMQKIDWKSIENANMATKEFKEMAIQAALALGTLEEFEGKIGVVQNAVWNEEKQIYEGGTLMFEKEWQNGVDFTNMANTLSKGKWLTNEVLTKVLDNYGAFTNELSDVYNELNEEVDITTSEIIKLTNEWIDNTIDWDEACAMTGKTAEELEAILSSLGREEYALGRKAFAAAQEAKTFREAIDATKDAVSTGFMNVFEQLFGNYEEAKVLWTDLANELWDIFASPISDLNDMLKAWNNIEMPDGTAIKGRDIFIQSIKDIYHAIRSVVDPITEAWEAIFPSIDFRKLFELTKQFQNFTSTLELSEESMEVVYTTFEGIFKTFALVGDVLKSVLLPFFKQLTGFGKDMDGGLFEIFGQFGEWLNGIIDSVRGSQKFIDFLMRIRLASYNVGKALHDLFRPGDIADIFNENGGGIGGAIAVLIEMLQDANDAFAGVAYAITGDKGVFQAISDLNGKLDITTEKIKTVIDTFEKKFGKIRDIFQPLVEAVKTIGSDFFEGLYMIFEDLGGAALNSVDGLNEWLDVINQMIEETPEIAEFVENVKEVVQEISNFFVHMLSLKDAVQIFRDAGGGIQGFFAVIDERVTYLIESLFDAIERLTGIDLHFVGDKIVDVIHAIGDGILWLADTIAKAFGWENNPFGGMLENGSGALGSLKEKISEFIGDGDYGTRLVNIFKKIGEGFESLWDIIQKASPTIAKVFGVIGKAVEWLVDQLTKLSLSDVFKLIIVGELAYLLKNLSWVLGGFSEVLEGFGLKLKAESIKAIATSILMIAGAAAVLALIPEDKMTGVIIGLATGFAGLIGVLIASRFAKLDNIFKLPLLIISISLALSAFANAMISMAGSVEKFGSMDTNGVIQGIIASISTMVVTLVAFIGALKSLSKNAGSSVAAAAALKSISMAMILMFVAVKLYDKVDFDTVLDSLGKMAILVGTIGLITALLNRVAGTRFADLGKSILGISAAMVLLSVSLNAIGKVDNFGENLLKLASALVVIGGLSSILALCTKGLEGFAGALFKLSTGMLLLSAGLFVFGLLSDLLGEHAEEMIDAGIDFIIMVLNKITERAPEVFGAIAELVKAILTEIGKALEDVDPEPFIKGAAFVSGLILAIFGIKKMKIGVKDILGIAALIAGIALLIVEIGALFYGMGALADITNAKEMIGKFDEVATAITDVFSLKFIALVGSLMGIILVMEKMGLGEKGKITKSTAGGSLKIFGMITLVIAEVATIIETMGLIFAAYGGLNSKIDGLPDAISKFGEFADAIAELFVGPFAILFTAIAAVMMILEHFGFGSKVSKGLVKGQTAIFGDIILVIAEVATIIEATGLIFAALGGLYSLIESWIGEGSIVQGIEKFDEIATAVATAIGDIIGAFVGGFAGGVVGGVVESTLKGVGNGLRYLGEEAKPFFEVMANLPESALQGTLYLADMILALTAADILEGMTSWFNGKVDYQKFGTGLASLGPGIKLFMENTKGITEEDATAASAVAGIVVAISKNVPKTDGIVQWITGVPNYARLASGLVRLGPAIVSFTSSISGLTEESLADSIAAADIIMAFADRVPKSGGLLQMIMGESDIVNLAANLPSLGTAIKDFSHIAKDIDTSVVENTKNAVDTVIELASAVPKTEETSWFWGMFTKSDTSMSDFSANLVEFGKSFVTYSACMEYVDADLVKQAAGALKATATAAKIIYEFDNVGKNDKLNAFGESLSNFGAKFVEYSSGISSFKEYAAIFKEEVINMIVDSFTQEDTSVRLTEAAGALIDPVTNGLSERIESDDGPISKFELFVERMITTLENSTLITRFYNAGLHLLSSAGNGLTWENNTSVYVDAFSNFIDKIRSEVDGSDRVNQFKRAGYNLLSYLREGLLYENLVASTRDDFGTFLDSLKELIESDERLQKFMEAGKSILNAIIHGFTDSQNLVFAEAEFNSFISDLSALIISSDNISKFQNAGSVLSNAVVSGMTSQDMQQQIKEVGKYVVEGFAVGMNESASLVTNATADMANAMLETAADTLGVASPSYKFKLLTLFCGEGAANGIWESIPNVVEKVHELAQSALDGLSNSGLVEEMKEIGLLGGGSLAEGLGSKLEGLLNLGDLLPEGMSDDAISNLFNTFMGGEDIQAFFDEGLSINPEKYFGDGSESTSEYIAGLLSEYNDVYDAGLGAESIFNDGLLEKYLEVYGTGDLTTSAYAQSLEDGQEKVEASTEKLGDGAIAGLESYAEGGDNVQKTKDAVEEVTDTILEEIDNSAEDYKNSGDARADDWITSFLENKNWAALSDEVKERIGNAMSGLFGYKLDEEGGLRRVNLSGEYIEVEEVPGSVITWNGTEGTIKSYVQNGVTGYNGSYSNAMATSAQFGMNIDKSEWVSSGDDEDDRIYQEIHKLNENFAEYNENVTNMQIVLDTGTVAGEMTPAINQNLGRESRYSARGM